MPERIAVRHRGLVGSTPDRWIVAGLIAFLCGLNAHAGEAEWRMLYEQTDLHFQRGNLEQAELFAREALREAETSLGKIHRSTELSLNKAAFILRLRGKHEEALALAIRAVEVSTRLHGADDTPTALA